MKCYAIDEIKRRLENLYDALKDITSGDRISEHPFDVHNEYSDSLLRHIDDLVEKANRKKDVIEKEIVELRSKIEEYCNDLEIEVPSVINDSIGNLCLKKTLYENEYEKICLKREEIKNDIKKMKDEIENLKNMLGFDNNQTFDVEMSKIESATDFGEIKTFYQEASYLLAEEKISKRYFESTEAVLKALKDELSKMELKRQYFYDEIENLCKILNKESKFSFQETISDLMSKLKDLKQECSEKNELFNNLFNEIRRRENYLNFSSKDFLKSFDDANLAEMGRYCKFLKEEQTRLFKEIFERTKAELYEINEIFGLKNVEYERNEESLNKIRETIDSLIPKKAKFISILENIKKRKKLLEEMTEFEKSASDPRRLFKSSFQLNIEEKFRNSAYPSLLKMEDALLEEINSYENEFGKLIHQDCDLKTELIKEIENRIINRTVFISRCDSPYRKKK